MEVCRNSALNKPAPIPLCPVISKKLRKNQPPVLDAFGPFPDETLFSSLDRILFFIGAQRVQNFLNLPIPFVEDYDNNSECAINMNEKYRSCATSVTECDSPCPSVETTKQNCCSKCQSCTSRTTNCKRPSCCSTNFTPRKLTAPLIKTICDSNVDDQCAGDGNCAASDCKPSLIQRSLSMCTLPCRKIKCPCTKPKWMWSRMHCHSTGAIIYEVFDDANGCRASLRLIKNSSPKFIFVVLPCGTTMPFESVSCH